MRDPTILPHGGQGLGGGTKASSMTECRMLLCLLMFPMIGKNIGEIPLKLTVVSREHCHLCDVVHRIALHLQQEFPIEVAKISAEADPTLLAHYGQKVPVVLIDGIEGCAGKITEGDLRRAIKRARWRRPISRILSRLGYAPRRG